MDARLPEPGQVTLVGAAAACSAGVLADALAHPLSTVKTRMQVQGSGGGIHGAAMYRGIVDTFWRVAKTEGPLRLYAGLGAALIGSAPGQGLYFGAYAVARRALGDPQSSAGHFTAGAGAQVCSSIVLVPVEVVKQRLQVQGQILGADSLSGSFRALPIIVGKEGMCGLYRGLVAHLASWMPFNGLYFMVYEWSKAKCIDGGYEDGFDNLEPTAQLCCGATAGVIASLATNPLDILKTRVQVAQASPAMFPYSGAWQAARHLLQHEGPSALMDGAFARALFLTARLTICVAAYERLKSYCS